MIIDNHLEIIAMCYIIFSIPAIILIVMNIARQHKLSIMHMCSVMYIATLFVVPAIILFGYINRGIYPSGISFDDCDLWTFYVQMFLTIIVYIFLHLGYMVKQRSVEQYFTNKNQHILFNAIIFSVISMVSLVLWASGYGGITELVANANRIRAGRLLSSNSFTFFKHFVPLSLLATWMLFNLIIRKEIQNSYMKFWAGMLLLGDTVLSSIYIQANDGRLLLMVFGLMFFLIYFKYQYEIRSAKTSSMMLKASIILFASTFIIFNADAILSMMREEISVELESIQLIKNISGEFAFIISGTQRSLLQFASTDFKWMIGNDIINGVFAWLPTSMKPIILEDVWDYNTGLLWTGGYGQTPTSIVAQSVYDMGMLGVIMIPFIYGIFIKKVELILEKRKGNIFYDTVYLVLGFYICKGIPYFSIYNIMINTFFVVIAIFIYKIITRVSYR